MQIKNIEVKTLRILRGLNGHAGSNRSILHVLSWFVFSPASARIFRGKIIKRTSSWGSFYTQQCEFWESISCPPPPFC
jgi:hypothetical protein